MAEGSGVAGVPACAQSGNKEVEKEEGDNAETQSAQRLRREERGAGRGWKAKFTENFTALVITCQGISNIVMIQTACLWGLS
jgi:hypothetical protein